MNNLFGILLNNQVRANIFIDVLADFRKGGVDPENKEAFKVDVELLKNNLSVVKEAIIQLQGKYNLKPLTQADRDFIIAELQRRGREAVIHCWHPESSDYNCSKDANGKVEIIDAHSIQNNKILKAISENGHVCGYKMYSKEIEGQEIGRKNASTFKGFCHKHDAIFYPIETEEYKNSEHQNFLFAYRAFTATAHTKLASTYFMDYGPQPLNDINIEKETFNAAIKNNNFNLLKTHVFEFPAFYPFSVSSRFSLDFDFAGIPIIHSEDRMENIYITFFPSNNKSYFLLSYQVIDEHLYGKLIEQLKTRNRLKKDISVIVAAHAENIFFNPKYYETFIKSQEQLIDTLIYKTSFDYVQRDSNGNEVSSISQTPYNYLNNNEEVNLFGY